MIDLKRVSGGKQERKPRILIYGGDGVGKTSFAAGAPDPFFIDVNRGSLEYDVNRVMPDTWPEVMEWIEAIEKGSVKCQTVVIDALGDLEHMGNLEFFAGTTIDAWGGGYGKGETVSLTRWRELLAALERVWAQGKGIIFVGHMQVKHFDDPTGPGYDRFVVAMREKTAGLLRQWNDYVLFAREEISQQKVGGDTKAVTSGLRLIHTRRSPAFDAKSRGTTQFPETIRLSWDDFSRARAADSERVKELRKEIDTMLAEIGDKTLEAQVKEYLRTTPGMIVEARNRVAARLEEKNKSAAPAAEKK